jgi:integrase
MMPDDLTSDNIPLSEPKTERAAGNHLAPAVAIPIAVDCNLITSAAEIAVDCKISPACDDPEVLRFVAAATSTNTRRAYQSDLAHFIAWGGTIPADAGTVARYLAHHASMLSPATLARRLVGIRRAHLDHGFHDPTGADLVRTVLRGIRRFRAQPQRRVAPLVAEELFAVCTGLGNSTRDIRDRALLLVGFAGAFRRSELVALDGEDVERSNTGMIITIRRSKTDQEGHGRIVSIARGPVGFCPVEALERWLTVAGISDGPVFRPVSKGGTAITRRLSTEAVASIIKRRVKPLGRDAARYSGHSLRAGFASSAARAGVPTWRIKAQTGHRSDSTLALYIRDVGL